MRLDERQIAYIKDAINERVDSLPIQTEAEYKVICTVLSLLGKQKAKSKIAKELAHLENKDLRNRVKDLIDVLKKPEEFLATQFTEPRKDKKENLKTVADIIALRASQALLKFSTEEGRKERLSDQKQMREKGLEAKATIEATAPRDPSILPLREALIQDSRGWDDFNDRSIEGLPTWITDFISVDNIFLFRGSADFLLSTFTALQLQAPETMEEKRQLFAKLETIAWKRFIVPAFLQFTGLSPELLLQKTPEELRYHLTLFQEFYHELPSLRSISAELHARLMPYARNTSSLERHIANIFKSGITAQDLENIDNERLAILLTKFQAPLPPECAKILLAASAEKLTFALLHASDISALLSSLPDQISLQQILDAYEGHFCSGIRDYIGIITLLLKQGMSLQRLFSFSTSMLERLAYLAQNRCLEECIQEFLTPNIDELRKVCDEQNGTELSLYLAQKRGLPKILVERIGKYLSLREALFLEKIFSEEQLNKFLQQDKYLQNNIDIMRILEDNRRDYPEFIHLFAGDNVEKLFEMAAWELRFDMKLFHWSKEHPGTITVDQMRAISSQLKYYIDRGIERGYGVSYWHLFTLLGGGVTLEQIDKLRMQDLEKWGSLFRNAETVTLLLQEEGSSLEQILDSLPLH